MNRYILVINPGSTSTKFAIFEEEQLVFEKSLLHSVSDLKKFTRVGDQFNFRKELILNELRSRSIDTARIKAVVGRGGFLKPIESGIYRVNSSMKKDLIEGKRGEHASNLGGLIADDIASELRDATAFIVDPVVVDELQSIARYAGHPEFSRVSIFHALNQKAVARLYARSIETEYENLNLIVAHMGGGVSVGAHCKGRVIDVNNGFDGDGPFSPERSGGVPPGQLLELCYSGTKSKDEVKRMITGEGGMVAYLGTNDFREICSMAENGDSKALEVQQAASYRIAKEIGAMSVVLKGDVDAIILTGGMAYQNLNTDYITKMVSYIARVEIYPGEDELRALAFNGLMALNGKAEVKDYL
jgi:butyrate kinase